MKRSMDDNSLLEGKSHSKRINSIITEKFLDVLAAEIDENSGKSMRTFVRGSRMSEGTIRNAVANFAFNHTAGAI